jgi:two-component system chemotaxis sensor kinase CheA
MGTITLNAYQGGNQIFVEVSDDGRGLNLQSIKEHALKKGIVTREMLSNMDNDDIYNIIFTPGFSTAERITDISGRGVGMNVVKEIVNELNGNVSIETEPGMGTRFVMAFPLTLAIIPAIMVMVAKEMYAIPLSDVIETIKVANDEITTIEGHEVINLRGEILSLVRLNEFVGIASDLESNMKIPVVVVGYGNRKIGMMVDYLEGKQEIVIKSLEQNYKTVEGLAGASILGDGSICLILDIASMINKVISDQDVLSRRDRQRVLEGVSVGLEKGEARAEEKALKPSLLRQKKRPRSRASPLRRKSRKRAPPPRHVPLERSPRAREA